ncbi:2646_t:CDS:2 [Gigaspora margarita]|uniref:2646_t:CDS:1 n=1 Tax=Gigaspora margarita TaxID=4874 RepID=A0ABN7VYS2_GIGMA|nr:2646_t:CDS:2 [Gigaspora margarita]
MYQRGIYISDEITYANNKYDYNRNETIYKEIDYALIEHEPARHDSESNAKKIIVLPLHQLITPSKNRRNRKTIPRSQNTAKNRTEESNEAKQLYQLMENCAKEVHNIIYPDCNYRPKNIKQIIENNIDDFALEKIRDSQDIKKDFKFISAKAAKNWSEESNEVKQLYQLIADCAREVHKIMYPYYNYRPKRKQFDYCFKAEKKTTKPSLPTSIDLCIPNLSDYDKKVWNLVDKLTDLKWS